MVAYHGDMRIVMRYLTPTEAHMLCGCLRAARIPAETGDTNLVQADELLSPALGGACLRVPEEYVAEALQVMDAFKRGEFALDDDFDVGPGTQEIDRVSQGPATGPPAP